MLVRDRAELGYAAEGAARQAAVALRGGVGGGAAAGGVRGKAAGVLFVTVVLWVVYGVLAPKPLLPSLARFVGVALPAPTATRLELLRPAESEVIHAGEALAIEIAVRGRAVEGVWFELLGEGEGSSVAARRGFPVRGPGREDRRTIVLAPHEVMDDLRFRCRAGDAVLEGVITVQPQPEIEGLRIELVPPAYTGESARTVSEPDLHIWAGTQARFELESALEYRAI